MTDDADLPLQPARPAEAQASLRHALIGRIDAAQGQLDAELLDLRRVGAGADPQLVAQLAGQLAMLTVLRQSVDCATPASLAQLQQAVITAVASAGAAVDQARAMTDPAPTSANYTIATAALDRKVAATFAIDQANEDEAHKLAEKYGVDLAELDAERARLKAERAAALARGDLLAVRKIDIQGADLTTRELLAVQPFVTDPADKAALAADIKSQSDIHDVRNSALAEQQTLEATRTANAPSPNAPVPAEAANMPSTGFAAFTSGLSLGGQIALSHEPEAHTKIEVPQIAGQGSGPSLGGVGPP